MYESKNYLTPLAKILQLFTLASLIGVLSSVTYCQTQEVRPPVVPPIQTMPHPLPRDLRPLPGPTMIQPINPNVNLRSITVAPVRPAESSTTSRSVSSAGGGPSPEVGESGHADSESPSPSPEVSPAPSPTPQISPPSSPTTYRGGNSNAGYSRSPAAPLNSSPSPSDISGPTSQWWLWILIGLAAIIVIGVIVAKRRSR